jgi:hypothetical protein
MSMSHKPQSQSEQFEEEAKSLGKSFRVRVVVALPWSIRDGVMRTSNHQRAPT